VLIFGGQISGQAEILLPYVPLGSAIHLTRYQPRSLVIAAAALYAMIGWLYSIMDLTDRGALRYDL